MPDAKRLAIPDRSNTDYFKLRGIGVIIGGLWIVTISYRGFINILSRGHWLLNAFVHPCVIVMFLARLFWKRVTANAPLWTATLTIPLSFLFIWLAPAMPFLGEWVL